METRSALGGQLIGRLPRGNAAVDPRRKASKITKKKTTIPPSMPAKTGRGDTGRVGGWAISSTCKLPRAETFNARTMLNPEEDQPLAVLRGLADLPCLTPWPGGVVDQ